MSPFCRKAALQHEIGNLVELSGQDGWLRLNELTITLEAQMRVIADRHASGAWLALLDRLGPIIGKAIPDIQDRLMPKLYSLARISKNVAKYQFITAPWIVDKSAFRSLDELVYLGLIWNNVEVASWRVAKGQTVSLNHDHMLRCELGGPPGIAKAISLYDERVRVGAGTQGAFVGSFGLPVATGVNIWNETFWSSLHHQRSLRAEALGALAARFDPVFPTLVDVRKLVPAGFLLGSKGLTYETQALATFLRTFERLALRQRRAPRWPGNTLSRFGYILTPPYFFRRLFLAEMKSHPIMANGWVSGNYRQAIKTLEENSSITPIGGLLMLDGVRASSAFQASFNRPLDGPAANYWGNSFEDEIQQLIDMTPWKPVAAEYRNLIKKKITLNGKPLTDIDAVAKKDGVLILVDCKAFVMNERLAAGDFDAAKGMREKVQLAADTWMDRIARVSNSTVGLNINLSGGPSVVGCVVMPFPPYVLEGTATEMLEGTTLRRVSSVREFLSFLLNRSI